jgi:hypothetical protein
MNKEMVTGMVKFSLFFGIALGFALLLNALTTDDAMTQCQKTHSYDVCFQQLNR